MLDLMESKGEQEHLERAKIQAAAASNDQFPRRLQKDTLCGEGGGVRKTQGCDWSRCCKWLQHQVQTQSQGDLWICQRQQSNPASSFPTTLSLGANTSPPAPPAVCTEGRGLQRPSPASLEAPPHQRYLLHTSPHISNTSHTTFCMYIETQRSRC